MGAGCRFGDATSRARAALPYVAERDTPLGRWAKELSRRAHRNVAIVAFANKLARIAWAVLRRGERFAVTGMPAAARTGPVALKVSIGQQGFPRG
jgi:hypothetical protein